MNKRFEVNGKRVSDLDTGLIWTRDAAMSEFPLSWEEAFAFVKKLNAGAYEGHADWRLPGRRELFSLVSHDRVNPCLPEGHPFENVFPGYYWTSTPCARLPDQAWYIHMGGARVYRGMKHAYCMVWPVCGRNPAPETVFQAAAENRFCSRGRVVRDLATGLSWTRRACLAASPVTWQEALDIIVRINRQGDPGDSDWRLPHIRELESLLDLAAHSPALPPGHPFEDVQEFYWSATTSQYETRYAWALYLRDGALGVGFKQNPGFFAWPVRGCPRF